MITLHIEAESISDLKTKIDNAVAGLYGSNAQNAQAVATDNSEPKTLKEKFRSKKRDAVIKETAEIIVDRALGEDELKKAKTKAKAKAKTKKAPTSAITVDKLREALQKVSSAKGLVEAKAILDSFDCPKISELEEKDHAAFIKKCEQSV